MNIYTLHTPHDFDDSTPTTYTSKTPVGVGDVIRVDNGFWHVILSAEPTFAGTVLELSQSAQSPQEARLLAQQLRHR